MKNNQNDNDEAAYLPEVTITTTIKVPNEPPDTITTTLTSAFTPENSLQEIMAGHIDTLTQFSKKKQKEE